MWTKNPCSLTKFRVNCLTGSFHFAFSVSALWSRPHTRVCSIICPLSMKILHVNCKTSTRLVTPVINLSFCLFSASTSHLFWQKKKKTFLAKAFSYGIHNSEDRTEIYFIFNLKTHEMGGST